MMGIQVATEIPANNPRGTPAREHRSLSTRMVMYSAAPRRQPSPSISRNPLCLFLHPSII